MKIPKKYSGHAAAILRELLESYNPPTKVEVMEQFYDSAEDGPEVDLILFFRQHPRGLAGDPPRCLDI